MLILHTNICCDPFSELPQQDSSDEGYNIWFHGEIRKNILIYHQIRPLIYSPDSSLDRKSVPGFI